MPSAVASPSPDMNGRDQSHRSSSHYHNSHPHPPPHSDPYSHHHHHQYRYDHPAHLHDNDQHSSASVPQRQQQSPPPHSLPLNPSIPSGTYPSKSSATTTTPRSKQQHQQQYQHIRKKENYLRIGDLVWAKIHGYPWWPGKVHRVSRSGQRFWVCFFGPDHAGNWAHVPQKDLRQFSMQHTAMVQKADGPSAMARALRMAIDEARKEECRRTGSDTEYSDDNDDACHVCGGTGELVLCDCCPRACHLSCADPPLNAVPTGRWLCYQCRHASPSSSSSSSSKASIPTQNYPLPSQLSSNGELNNLLISHFPPNRGGEYSYIRNSAGVGPVGVPSTRPEVRIVHRGYWALLPLPSRPAFAAFRRSMNRAATRALKQQKKETIKIITVKYRWSYEDDAEYRIVRGQCTGAKSIKISSIENLLSKDGVGLSKVRGMSVWHRNTNQWGIAKPNQRFKVSNKTNTYIRLILYSKHHHSPE